jgi:hypothetical protein
METPLRVYITPFDNLSDFFIALKIVAICDKSDTVIKNIVCNLINKEIDVESISLFIKRVNQYPSLYPKNVFDNNTFYEDKLELLIEEADTINIYSKFETCLFCNTKLTIESLTKKPLKAKCYLYNQKSKNVNLYTKWCSKCDAIHSISYAQYNDKERRFSPSVCNEKYIAFTNETIFERLLLDSFTSDLLFKHSTFMGFTNAYNHLFKNIEGGELRNKLYEKRFSEAYFYYKYLEFEIERGLLNSRLYPCVHDLDSRLREIKNDLLPFFTNKWSGPYHTDNCNHEKCSNALVIDGIFKTNRLRCLYQDQTMKVQEIDNFIYKYNVFLVS